MSPLSLGLFVAWWNQPAISSLMILILVSVESLELEQRAEESLVNLYMTLDPTGTVLGQGSVTGDTG